MATCPYMPTSLRHFVQLALMLAGEGKENASACGEGMTDCGARFSGEVRAMHLRAMRVRLAQAGAAADSPVASLAHLVRPGRALIDSIPDPAIEYGLYLLSIFPYFLIT